MELTVEAVYENGVFRPLKPVPLSPRERVELTINSTRPRESEEEQKARMEKGLEAVRAFKSLHPLGEVDPYLAMRIAMDEEFSPLHEDVVIEASYEEEEEKL